MWVFVWKPDHRGYIRSDAFFDWVDVLDKAKSFRIGDLPDHIFYRDPVTEEVEELTILTFLTKCIQDI